MSEYYGLKNDHTCVFKYTRLIAIGLILIVLLLMGMIFLIAKCVCLEKSPEKESYGSILTQDNDLMSDHYKTARDEIGINKSISGEKKRPNHDNSIVSNVEPIDGDNSYLNISNVSVDPVISTLLAPPTQNFMMGSEQGDCEDEPEDFHIGGSRNRGRVATENVSRGNLQGELFKVIINLKGC